MTFKGMIRQGKVLVSQAIPLPDGTPVRVEIDAADWAWRWEKLAEHITEQWQSPLSSLDAVRENRR